MTSLVCANVCKVSRCNVFIICDCIASDHGEQPAVEAQTTTKRRRGRPSVRATAPIPAPLLSSAVPLAPASALLSPLPTPALPPQQISSGPQESNPSPFRYFPNDQYEEVLSDQFCDDTGPHPRYLSKLQDRSHGYMEPRRLFESMLPMNYLENVVCQATSKNLEQIQEPPLSFEEFMLYIGYWLSMTLISVDRRQDYWKTSSDFLSPAHNFAQYGITRERFRLITQCLQLSSSPSDDDCLDNVLPLIEAFNRNMRAQYVPSFLVCVDESMVQWTNPSTIPNFVYIPRKPTPMGQEFHTLADGTTKVIFAMEAVLPLGSADRRYDALGKMNGVVLRLCEAGALFCDQRRILVGDSAFASVRLMQELHHRGIHSIFAFKKRRYWPKDIPGDDFPRKVQALPIGGCISRAGITPDGFKFFLSGQMDLKPSLLMATAGSNNQETGVECSRFTLNADGSKTTVKYRRTEVHDLFYKARHSIDDNNNIRQNARSIEEAWQSKSWQHRTFAYVIGTAESNAFLLRTYKGGDDELSHVSFRRTLARAYMCPTASAPTRVLQEHRLEKFKPNQVWSATRATWVRQPTTKWPQKACSSCSTRSRMHCICNPTLGMCLTCFPSHILNAL